MKTAVLIVAGGEGKRFGSPLPKQFVKLSGKEIFIRSVELFFYSPFVDRVVLILHPAWIEKGIALLKSYGLNGVKVVPGGKSRQQSVFNGLNTLRLFNPQRVMIHDAARPLFNAKQIEEILKLVEPKKGVVIAEKVTDTIYQVEENHLSRTLDRTKLWKAQTPQCFFFQEILKAHKLALKDHFEEATDDATLYAKYVGEVFLLSPLSLNLKITTQNDLQIAELYLKELGR
ncbi:MAG TPA: 2-C-methyl-D-erythritol 4-phosphate cytidylyltransferase [Kosmotoga arenicorallina]|uniref:2-C-methyl-D-erythritol 4-phosphate cytidylyltransferase n=1 Tax=Kosmotoga arenicorallina TaxID=688066 RepID=A0A7C5DV13_9BACT|nr:2-C-methyl-D-erythritol 4-phosphate cytidylyltransferase [Kosmotoga arenicorallina]